MFKKKNRNCFNQGTFGDRTLAYSGPKVQSRFYPGDLVTRTGDREIPGLSGRGGIYANEDLSTVFNRELKQTRRRRKRERHLKM